MKRRNATRSALFTSIISLLLCVSMLVGTTFAWFTDEVVTGMNTIAAGNLDVELLADGNKVDSTTKLFDDVEWWEPGVVVYENIQVANVGTLALKYQMTLNFRDVNDLNGHKLSEVVKVAVIDKVESGATRAEVLAEAKENGVSLSNFYLTGDLEAGEYETEKAIVVYWAPNDNATDNLYNANNGQVTSDGNPLSIEFGINLQATQKMSEEDSFGNDYDEFASILPKAKVIDQGAQIVTATTTFPNGTDALEYSVPFVLQFQPNETYEEAQSSAYRYWHADYVVKADKDVPADSMALIGYYKAFCDAYNNGNWVAMTNEGTAITAGTEIRLVELLGATVNYEEICNYGNDGTGFLCTATDLTGANAGTTLTVELRLYETTKAPDATSGTANEETGNYEVVGTYTYTFANEVSTVEDLVKHLTAGNAVKLVADLDLTDTKVTIPAGANPTLDMNGHTISGAFSGTGNQEMFLVKGNMEVKDGTFSMTATQNQGWNAMAAIFDVTGGGELTLENVEADVSGTDMNFIVHLNNWGDASLYVDNCDFTTSYVAVRAFNSGNDMNNVTIKNTDFHGGRVFWVHNYTSEGKDDSTLNLDIYGNNNTTDHAKPVRFGFSGSTYYTIDGALIESATTQDELKAAVSASDDVDVTLSAGAYTLPGTSGDVTISGDEDVVVTVTGTTAGEDVTFNGVTVQGSGVYTGVNASTVTYNDATIVGTMCLYGDKVVFNDCTFDLTAGGYLWTYGADEVEFNNCTFNTAGKAILIYNEGNGASNVTVKGCTFNATAGAKASAIANQNCAAIEIDNYQSSGTGAAHALTTEGNTYSNNFSGEWRIKSYTAGNPVTVNGVTYTSIAIDGKLMTIDADKNVTVQ